MRGARRRRVGHRAESRIRGYRGIIVVGLVIVLVVAASLAGLFRPALCLIDSAGCVALPEPGATPTSAVELPAASDELAVSVTAGRGAVPPGRHDSAAGTEAVTSLGRVPSLRALWSGAPE